MGMSQTQQQIEQLAIRLYTADAMQIAVYDTAEQSWQADREGVRQRYRDKAKQMLCKDENRD